MAKSSSTSIILLGLGAVAVGAVVLSKGSASAQTPASPGTPGTPGLPPGTPGGPIAPETPSQMPSQGGCQLDANIPPSLAQQINAALSTPGVPSSVYTQLAQLAQQNNYPMAAACLSQAAAKASANPSIFSSLHNQALLASIFAQQPPTNPVDWSNLNTSLLNQVAAFKAQGLSSAQALQAANLMQGGATQSQALIAILQQQGIPIAQANQIVALVQQGVTLPQAISQTTPPPVPSSTMTSWQTQAQNQLMLAGWSGPSAMATVLQLTDPQARYFTRLVKHSVSVNDALVAAQQGASTLNQEPAIESTLSPSQLAALNTLIVNAWEADNITTPRVTSDRPPTPAQELIVEQLAANLAGQKADFFNQLVSTGSGVRQAYTQVTGDSNFPKG